MVLVELDPASAIIGVAAVQGTSASFASALNPFKLGLFYVSNSGVANKRFVGEQLHSLRLFIGHVFGTFLLQASPPIPPLTRQLSRHVL